MRRRAFLRLAALLVLCGRRVLSATPAQAQEDEAQEWGFPLAFPAYFRESPTVTAHGKNATYVVNLPFVAN